MTHPTDDELKDLAHSAYEEAMSFGLSVDTFLRYFKGIRNRALLAEQARTEPTGGFARLAPNALPVGTLYPAIYPAKTAAQPLKAEQAKDAAEDAELLDWIFRQGDEFSYYVIQDAPGDGEYVVHGMGCSGQGKTPRAAIRAARAAERKA
jgi:hypothetical protein